MSTPTAGVAAAQGPRDRPQEVEVRSLREHAEYAACVQLQRDTWGRSYQDIVPASMLKVSQRVGGITAGAFDETGRLVGFVYGLTGVGKDGRPIHWSHMLAVHPDYRNHGIGRQLKEFQRRSLAGTAVGTILWTFDPLVARNAHLNLNRLGAHVTEYVPDMYADTGSELHSFGTDRFVVSWTVQAGSDCAKRAAPPRRAPDWGPVVNGAPESGDGVAAEGTPHVRIEIPADVESMSGAALDEARAWRASTRDAFLTYLRLGYRIEGFVRDRGRCFYVLHLVGVEDGGC